MPKGIIGGLMVLIGLGLILKFGRSANALANTGVYGTTHLINSLQMSNIGYQGP